MKKENFERAEILLKLLQEAKSRRDKLLVMKEKTVIQLELWAGGRGETLVLRRTTTNDGSVSTTVMNDLNIDSWIDTFTDFLIVRYNAVIKQYEDEFEQL